MKALAIVALLLGLGAIGASTFAKVETYPNYEYMKGELESGPPATPYDVPLLEEYKSTIDLMHYIAWGAGGLALVLGIVAYTKRKGPLPLVAAAAGAVGVGLSFLTMT
jgi:hypothetical protein